MERRGFLRAIGLAPAWAAVTLSTARAARPVIGDESESMLVAFHDGPASEINAMLEMCDADGEVLRMWPLACEAREMSDGSVAYHHDPVVVRHEGAALYVDHFRTRPLLGTDLQIRPKVCARFGVTLLDDETVTLNWSDRPVFSIA